MTQLATLAPFLICPKCAGDLAERDKDLACSACSATFPTIERIPWVYADVQARMAEWRGNALLYVRTHERDIEAIKDELRDEKLLPETRRRLQKQLQALVEHLKATIKLIEPLGLGATASLELAQAMKNKLPVTQSISSYYVNIHRDWGWPDQAVDENRVCLETVLKVLPDGWKPQRVLVLGSGASRLAYDLHRVLAPETTIVTDINPLIFYAAERIVTGKAVKLYEFPIAPRDGDSYAVLRKCEAPAPLREGFHFVFADAMDPPFRAGMFDLVVTPWLIDIIPQDFAEFSRRVNRLVTPGGTWLNFGSVAFNTKSFRGRYGKEEVLALVDRAGFRAARVSTDQIPYMHSPASQHARLETVLTFAAEKTSDVEQPKPYQYLPDWLIDAEKPVPALPMFRSFGTIHGVYVDVISLIDGSRSIAVIARAIGQKYGLSEADARTSLTRFLTTVFEENQIGRTI